MVRLSRGARGRGLPHGNPPPLMSRRIDYSDDFYSRRDAIPGYIPPPLPPRMRPMPPPRYGPRHFPNAEFDDDYPSYPPYRSLMRPHPSYPPYRSRMQPLPEPPMPPLRHVPEPSPYPRPLMSPLFPRYPPIHPREVGFPSLSLMGRIMPRGFHRGNNRAAPRKTLVNQKSNLPASNGEVGTFFLTRKKKKPVEKVQEIELNKKWVTEALKAEIMKKFDLFIVAREKKTDADAWQTYKDQRILVRDMNKELKAAYLLEHPEEDLSKLRGIQANKGKNGKTEITEKTEITGNTEKSGNTEITENTEIVVEQTVSTVP